MCVEKGTWLRQNSSKPAFSTRFISKSGFREHYMNLPWSSKSGRGFLGIPSFELQAPQFLLLALQVSSWELKPQLFGGPKLPHPWSKATRFTPTCCPALCHLYRRYVWKSSAFFSKYFNFSVMGARSSSRVRFISEGDSGCPGALLSQWDSVMGGERRHSPGLVGLRFKLPSELEEGTSTEPTGGQLYPCLVAILKLLPQGICQKRGKRLRISVAYPLPEVCQE